MKKLTFLSFCILLFSCATEKRFASKKIAITIDDLPVVGSWQMAKSEQEQVFQSTLDVLKKHNIKAYGFVNGLSIQKHQTAYLDNWVKVGHKIDNHTFSHFNLNYKSNKVYIKDIEKGEKAIKKWQVEPKYFRYPFLVRGNTMKKRLEVESFLKKKNYIIAPVSIDSSDWKYNAEYIKAIKQDNQSKSLEIADDYLDHIKEQTRQARQLSEKHLDRAMKHIFLIHLNKLNADHLDKVLSWYKSNGWEFITLEEAMTDPVYSMKDEYVGDWGVTWPKMLFKD